MPPLPPRLLRRRSRPSLPPLGEAPLLPPPPRPEPLSRPQSPPTDRGRHPRPWWSAGPPPGSWTRPAAQEAREARLRTPALSSPRRPGIRVSLTRPPGQRCRVPAPAPPPSRPHLGMRAPAPVRRCPLEGWGPRLARAGPGYRSARLERRLARRHWTSTRTGVGTSMSGAPPGADPRRPPSPGACSPGPRRARRRWVGGVRPPLLRRSRRCRAHSPGASLPPRNSVRRPRPGLLRRCRCCPHQIR